MKQETREERAARLDREYWEIFYRPMSYYAKANVVTIPVSAQDAALIREVGAERLRLWLPRDDAPAAVIRAAGPISIGQEKK
jgi:hypothetical protein